MPEQPRAVLMKLRKSDVHTGWFVPVRSTPEGSALQQERARAVRQTLCSPRTSENPYLGVLVALARHDDGGHGVLHKEHVLGRQRQRKHQPARLHAAAAVELEVCACTNRHLFRKLGSLIQTPLKPARAA